MLAGLFLAGFAVAAMYGCATKREKPVPSGPVGTKATLTGYTIQVGAFRDPENAALLTRSLASQGIDAYYFRTDHDLIKVRFGDYSSLVEARRRAVQLVRAGIIDEYYIVPPRDRTAFQKEEAPTEDGLRNEIVETARSFIGLPYRWGGASAENGFDCSGLVMAVYHLNGITLPRTSKAQYHVGKALSKAALTEGDLVFFDISGSNRVSHVGIYVGHGEFVHAPGKGKTIRTDSLSSTYFAPRYVGGRSCL